MKMPCHSAVWVSPIVALIALTLVPQMSHAQNLCEDQFKVQSRHVTQQMRDPLLDVDLMEYRREEVQGMTREQVTSLNAETLKNIEALPIRTNTQRVTTVSPEVVGLVIESMAKNPIIKDATDGKYDQPDVSIGYCFGRAAYAHLALLKMGVDSASIRKAWAVGPMRGTDGIDWKFHVATIVRAHDGTWLAADSLLGGKIVTLDAWFANFAKENVSGDLRLYTTDARKFSARPVPIMSGEAVLYHDGGYRRVDMGLDLQAQDDYYSGFFKNLMGWFRSGELESVGLKKLR